MSTDFSGGDLKFLNPQEINFYKRDCFKKITLTDSFMGT